MKLKNNNDGGPAQEKIDAQYEVGKDGSQEEWLETDSQTSGVREMYPDHLAATLRVWEVERSLLPWSSIKNSGLADCVRR